MKDSDTLDTTIGEWQAELQQLTLGSNPGRTCWELAEELGISMTTMRRRLLNLIQDKRCTYAYGQRKDRRGRPYQVAVYQLIPQKKAK